MWYGCGNTSLPNPSTMRVGLKPNGRIALHQGAVDIGQGSNTIVTQICADAMRRSHRSLRSGFRRYFDHARLRQNFRLPPDICYRKSRRTWRARKLRASHSAAWPRPANARPSSSFEDGAVTV